MSRTMYIACSSTYENGAKIGDAVSIAYTARLFVENEPHDRILLSLNPNYQLNFVFTQFIKDFNVQIVRDDWPLEVKQSDVYARFDERRREREVEGVPFDTYKELYLRIDGGTRQKALCGSEKGLGHRNIFSYYFFGQESSPEICKRETDFRPSAFGWTWEPTAPPRSVFVSPHAVSQGNEVFTLEFWRKVIDLLMARKIQVTVNTPNKGWFGYDDRLAYSFQSDLNFKALQEQISHQRLCLGGNTGTGWLSAASGTPVIAGEPDFFWYMDYRYRECGIPAVNIFNRPDPEHIANLVHHFLAPCP